MQDNTFTHNIDHTIDILKGIQSQYENDIDRARSDGYKNGLQDSFKKAMNVIESKCNIANIDWESIKLFSCWCYINGINFSYMGKSTDEVPFTTRVVDKFKKDVEEDEKGWYHYENN